MKETLRCARRTLAPAEIVNGRLGKPPRVADVERRAEGHEDLTARAVRLHDHEARRRAVGLAEDDALRPPVRRAAVRGPGHDRGEPGAVEARGHEVPGAQAAVASAGQAPEDE